MKTELRCQLELEAGYFNKPDNIQIAKDVHQNLTKYNNKIEANV